MLPWIDIDLRFTFETGPAIMTVAPPAQSLMSAPAWDVLDALDEGIYTIDPDGNCLFVNRAALRILGYDTADDLLGRNMHDMIHHTRPDGSAYPRAECPLVHTARGGHPTRLANETLWRRDGTPFLAEYSAYALHAQADAPDAAPTGSVITFREEVVREDARTRLAVQYAVSQVLTGNNGVRAMILRVLETIATGFGWDAARYWKSTPSGLELMTAWPADGAYPDDAPQIGVGATAWSSRRAAHRTSLSLSLGPAGFPGRSAFAFPVSAGPDEAAFGVMEFFSRRIVPADPLLLGAVENIGHLIGQTLDRFRTNAALRDSESRFRIIADAIPQLSWMTDATGSITWYNQRFYDYTGTTFEEMAGWGWKAVHHPDHLDRVVRGFEASIRAGEPWEDTFPLRAADGSYRWFLSRALPIQSETEIENHDTPSGRILGWFGSNTDITALRDAEQSQVAALDEAEAANLAKSLFLANMSHELRTPLSAIIGYSEMLIEEVEEAGGSDQVMSDVRKIESNARHLLGLINDVLDLSKVESGKMEAFAETFDIATVVTDVAATVGPLMEKNDNALDLRLGDGLGSMHSDVTRIRQMLLNLLSNAAKFTSNGRVTLSVRREQDVVRFAVTDTGLGMTEEQLAKLFQRFQQADASTTRKFGGTGLGLSLTRVFSHLLGGDVEVTSVLNQGSTFTLVLPATLPAPAGGEEPAPEESAHALDRQTVLVIDDDQTQRELASRFLERTGFAPVTAPDGATGLTLAHELQPHAILLDVTMPGLDGWSVLNALKADPVTAEIPVIMVSLVDAQPLAESLGAADYVMKPVEWDRLRNVLDRFREHEGDILIIDDDQDLRLRLRRILESNGWSVSEAANGTAALAHIDEALPRVILLDLNMPKMDGFEFLKLLRDRPGCGTVPVVVLSAKDLTLDDRRRLRGADQVLNKSSTSLNELANRLRTMEGLAKS